MNDHSVPVFVAFMFFLATITLLGVGFADVLARLERIEKRWDAQKVEEPSRLDALEQRVKDLEEKR